MPLALPPYLLTPLLPPPVWLPREALLQRPLTLPWRLNLSLFVKTWSHIIRKEGKRTGSTYDRHYKAYITWFNADQAMLAHADTSYEAIPTLPITAAKVTCFLTHEMQRPKKRKLPDGTQLTSTCGHEHAKQVVSSLEYHRFNNQHLYRDNPNAQVILRSDSRIKTMEAAFAENEPERIKKAHALKAVGTRADMYDDSQLSKLATSGLDSKGLVTIWHSMRDRAIYVLL
ncbi:hypothetical protein DFH07DRAFT_784342 [Mycena maculata]|uniref:Uncharacterized protein n=1 Tax=Mycena maculata TaxID=230809 RepID=A0AAD7MK68_9AGAR|nr:hypothetical protein DFH07DRAFT_784342 [Mycena maculata]